MSTEWNNRHKRRKRLTHQQHTRTTYCRPWKKQEENLKKNKVKTVFLLQIHLGTWKHMHSYEAELKASLGYSMRLCLTKINKIKETQKALGFGDVVQG